MKNFVLVGAAGFIAPRHLHAIKETGNNLLAAFDPNDSVGILDSYFPNTSFFVEFERFDRYVDKLQRSGTAIDYCSICSPNYLHDSHIRYALRNNMNVICEKPLVLNPWNALSLIPLEKESGKKVNTILQLRLHPDIIKLKEEIEKTSRFREVELTYITSRGNWYYTGWKGDISKSGGITTNIGIHFFDMLIWLFGNVKNSIVQIHSHDRAAGILKFENASVKWFLSINANTLPQEIQQKGEMAYRSIKIDGIELAFTTGFDNLHVSSYEQILKGNGFGIADSLPAIELAHQIRTQTPIGLKGNYHSFATIEQTPHPFKKENL